MRNDDLSDEDKALFKAAVASVKPLRKNGKIHEVNKRADIPTKIKPKIQKNTPISLPNLSDFVRDEVSSSTILSYSKTGVQSSQIKALKEGQIHFEARLDLHGLKAQDLSIALSDFIIKKAFYGTKCVLLVHGKGGQHGAPPVIKNLVNCYLPQFEEVIAFHSALPKHGGTGAVYVLLKALKKTL